MRQINIITDSPSQTMILKLESGQSLNFSLWYSYVQKAWFYSFTYGTYKINNRKIVHSTNMIRGLRNAVPFGLACRLTDKYESVFIEDFLNGRAKLYTLSPSDVALVETNLVNA